MARGRFGLVAAALVCTSCGALVGLGDAYVTGGVGGDGADASTDGASAADGGGADGTFAIDAPPSDALAEAPPGPDAAASFCDYAEYFSFDSTLAGSAGDAPSPPDPEAYDTGKYDKCAKFGKAGQNPTSTLYALGSRFLQATGSIAFWFLPDTWNGCTTPRTLWSSTATNAGPFMDCTIAGVVLRGPFATSASTSGTWQDDAWNHAVATWGPVAPAYQFSLNGNYASGLGLYSPVSSAQFNFDLGSDNDPPDACYDELAIWTRTLTQAEMKAVYALTTTIKSACGR